MIDRTSLTLSGVAVGVLTVVVVLSIVAGGVAAQETTTETNTSSIENNSDYYNGTIDVNSGPWFDGIEDASLDSLGQMATRLGTFFVGTGTQDPSGTGFQGALLTGVIMAAALVGSIASVGVGPVGGSVIAVVIGYGMTEVGLAPSWFRILLLFAIGIIAFVSLSNVMEGR